MATNYVRYVDPDADAGGDGTTANLTGATCAFKSLFLAEDCGGAASQPPLDLTAASDTYTVNCGSASSNHTADSTTVSWSGWTTSTSCRITINGEPFGGYFNTSKYRMTAQLGVSVANGDVNDMQVSVTGSGVAALHTNIAGGGGSYGVARRCFFRATGTGAGARGYHRANGGSVSYIINCVLISVNSSGYYCASSVWTCAYNSIFITGNASYSAYQATYNSSSTKLKNCYAANYGSGSAWSFGSSNVRLNLASDDTTATGTGALTNVAYSTENFTDTTSGSEVLTSAATGALINAGATINESAPLDYTNDINGVSRPVGSAWDIGPFETDISTQIKTVMGLARSSVKTVNALAIASAKTVNTLA